MWKMIILTQNFGRVNNGSARPISQNRPWKHLDSFRVQRKRWIAFSVIQDAKVSSKWTNHHKWRYGLHESVLFSQAIFKYLYTIIMKPDLILFIITIAGWLLSAWLFVTITRRSKKKICPTCGRVMKDVSNVADTVYYCKKCGTMTYNSFKYEAEFRERGAIKFNTK